MKNEAESSENPFLGVMKERTVAELIEILTLKSQDYQPEAVAAAKEIFKSRNLTANEIKSATDEIAFKIENEKKISAETLPWYLKVLFAIFPFIGFVMALIYLSDQKTRKYRQAWRFAVIPWIVIFSLVSMVERNFSFILAIGILFILKSIIDRKKTNQENNVTSGVWPNGKKY